MKQGTVSGCYPKLPPGTEDRILARYRAGDCTMHSLAIEYGITVGHIWAIITAERES